MIMTKRPKRQERQRKPDDDWTRLAMECLVVAVLLFCLSVAGLILMRLLSL